MNFRAYWYLSLYKSAYLSNVILNIRFLLYKIQRNFVFFLIKLCIINNIHNTTKVKVFCDVFEDVSYAYQFEHKNLFDQKYI